MARKVNRRQVLASVGAGSLVGIAGCTGGANSGNGGSGGGDSGDTNDTGGSGSTSSEIEARTLTYTDFLPENHLIAKSFSKRFLNKVEELSDGKITFDTYWGQQLTNADQNTQAIRDRTADIGLVSAPYESDTVPLSDIGSLPGFYTSSHQGSVAYYQTIMNEIYEAELKPLGIKPLTAQTLAPYQILTQSVKVESLEDWKGLKIRGAGGVIGQAIKQLGATAVEMSGNETYQSMERGTVDGTVFPLGSVPTYDLQDVVDYGSTNVAIGGGCIYISMNHNLWNSFSEKAQEVFLQAGEETAPHAGKAQDEEAQSVIEDVDEISWYDVPDENWQNWQDTMQPVIDKWVDQREKNGDPGQKVLNAYKNRL